MELATPPPSCNERATGSGVAPSTWGGEELLLSHKGRLYLSHAFIHLEIICYTIESPNGVRDTNKRLTLHKTSYVLNMWMEGLYVWVVLSIA